MTRHDSIMQGGAVEKEKTPHARGPGFESPPDNFFPFFFVFFQFFLPIDWFQFIHSDAPR